MPSFRDESKQFLRDLSQAAAWMMRKHVGADHYWRSGVLTTKNPDTDQPPYLDGVRAGNVFEELVSRGLLVKRADDVDGSGQPAYTMKYDIDGWDKAVADGRPMCALFMKIRRSWLILLCTFLLGCLLTTIENRVVEFINTLIDGKVEQKSK